MKAFVGIIKVVSLFALFAFLGSSAFATAPAKKLHAPDSTKAQQVKNLYVCPMHPEVTSAKPGKCPKCKMDLVKAAKKEPAVKKNASAVPEKKAPVKIADAYACPMHPDVTSDKPGKCPKCKMELVKKAS